MATGSASGMRPWLWLGMGAVAVVVGVVMGIQAISALGDPGDLAAAPRCRTAFASGCVTERAAVVLQRLYGGRGAWLTQEQKWLVLLTGGGPDGSRAELDVPRQSGRGELSSGLPVAVQFYGRRAAAVRLPSGRTLETTDHPRRYATFLGFLAMFSIGLGWFGARSGWQTGVRAGFWRKTSSPVRTFGPMAAVGVAGMAGALLEELTGMRRLSLAGAAGVLALCGWAWWRLRGREAGGAVGEVADVPDGRHAAHGAGDGAGAGAGAGHGADAGAGAGAGAGQGAGPPDDAPAQGPAARPRHARP